MIILQKMSDKTDSSVSKKLLEIQRTLGWMDLVLGNITDAVYVTDKNGIILFANQFFSNLLTVPRVFLLGQELQDVFRCQIKKDSQQEFLCETDNFSGSGVYKWTKDTREYIFKISHRIIPTTSQAVYIAKDITAEHELSVIKSNFINIASHQLRTPMTTIMTNAHMLNDGLGGTLDGLSKKLTEGIIKSSERMIRLINDILLITRIQNGETSLLARNGSLISVLDTVESEIEVSLRKKKLHFSKAYDPCINIVDCNTFIVHEIISNLMTNAIQYTPENGRISLSVEKSGDQVAITVTDNGIGIPKKDIPIVFDQFSRAPNAMEAFNEGTGLGLYVVKFLLTQIAGTIDCKSTLGAGTTFRVLFPA